MTASNYGPGLPRWPATQAVIPGSAIMRATPEDFVVSEELGFEPDGAGEHVFLYLQKRQLNTQDLVARVARHAGVAIGHIGFCGLKDRHAVTRQWLSVPLAVGREPDWTALEEAGDVGVLRVERHARKLRRGVHRSNRFAITLRALSVDREALETALHRARADGVPNYFGEQRFGRNGSSLQQARDAVRRRNRLSRAQRQRLYSALRAFIFNELLAQRVRDGSWNRLLEGDVCALHGSRSVFVCDVPDAALVSRVQQGDVHPALPLWGTDGLRADVEKMAHWYASLSEDSALCDYLDDAGLTLGWRSTRLLPDDFCWEFCDDGSLLLNFALGAGNFATALLAELVHCHNGSQPIRG